jgi:hypothetical protein
LKRCTKCRELKDKSAFSKNKKLSDGLAANCKACNRIYNESYHERHPDYRANWRKANPDYSANWRKKHPDYDRNWQRQRSASGIVYIWFDIRNKRYYIGAKWFPRASYVCSSPWMNNEYRARPQDFKRRILSRHDSIEEMHEEEFRLLQMIKPHEIGSRYYNRRIAKQGVGRWRQAA